MKINYFVLSLVISSFWPGLLLAASSFSIAPAKVEVSLNPGQTMERTITVTNRSAEPVAFEVGVQDIAPSGQERDPISLLGDERGPYSLKNYLIPAISSFILDGGEAKTILIKIVIPPQAPPAGLYGAVTVSTNNVIDQTAVGARVRSSLGALFFVKINGPVKETGKLIAFRLQSSRLLLGEKLPIFEIIFKNEGNIYLNPYGVIGLKKWGRGAPTVLAVDPWFVLPGSSRLREVTATDHLTSGLYRADLFQNRGYNNIIDTQSVWFLKLSLDWGVIRKLFSFSSFSS